MKKYLRKGLSLILATGLAAAMLAGCGGSSSSGSSSGAASSGTDAAKEESTDTTAAADTSSTASDAEFTLKIGGQWADSSVHSRMIKEVFIPEVEEKSGGRIKCEFYGNNAVGNEVDQLSQLQMNTLQMATLSDQSATLDQANLTVLYLPYLFEDEAHWEAVVDGEIGQELVANLPSQGIRVLGYSENGYRQVTTAKKAINTAEDMKGLKMRVTSSDMYIAIFEALGCSCQAMTIAEAYTALETGTCDGQDNAYNTIVNANFNEVQKYLANTNHVLGSLYIAVSETWYQTLPDDLKTAVQEAVTDACVWERQTYRELAEEDHKKLLDAGMTETNPDIESFKEATSVVYDKFIQKYPEMEDVIARIQSAK